MNAITATVEVQPIRRQHGRLPAESPETERIRRLIWLYLILWIAEGGLRRWFLPSLTTPLLVIRDPLAIAIYYLAFSAKIFPMNGFVIWGAVLAVMTFLNAVIVGHGNFLVAIFGVRCDFLHIPMIFIMARVLGQKDIMTIAKATLYMAIPYTLLLMLQYRSPQDAWVNRGIGGSLDGAGFVAGATGHFRPPGTFSFTTGPAQLYPIIAACWFALLVARNLPVWLTIAAGLAIVVAIPASISRALFLGVALVVFVGIAALFAGGRITRQSLFKALLAAILLPILAFQMPGFNEALESFSSRWDTATEEGGGFQGAIVERVVNGLFGSFSAVHGAGFGTGYSTNVGQKLLTEEVGFGASEAEWGRLLWDNGLLLGSALIIYRTMLAGSILFAALRAWRFRSTWGAIFASSAVVLLLNGQWGQASTLGAAVVSGGLALASSQINLNPRTGGLTRR